MCYRIVNLCWLICWLVAGLACAAPLRLEGEQRWQGSKRLTQAMKLERSAVLYIAAGTRIEISDPQAKLSVRGRLLIDGTAQQPVVFVSPAGWQGIEFVEAAAGSRIVHARFAGCQQAISVLATSPEIAHNQFQRCDAGVQLLRESAAMLEQNDFSDNRLGLAIGMRSSPTVRGNRFSGHQAAVQITSGSSGLLQENLFLNNRHGLVLQQMFNGQIRNNRFDGNEVAAQLYQTRNTPLFTDNVFIANQQALAALSFSYPAVLNNRFIDNGTALNNDQFGSARVEHNLFLRNDTAISNLRKSNSQVSYNRFEENGLALFCDYSSYPQVKQNNFSGNRRAAELGQYQSADWEQQAGSKQLLQQQAQQRGSRNPLLAEAPTEFVDQVDLSGNWWGEQTAAMRAAGAAANLEMFFDRRDKPQVNYPGYGSKRYRLDLIVYAPWLEQPVAGAGPQEAE